MSIAVEDSIYIHEKEYLFAIISQKIEERGKESGISNHTGVEF